ncbi:MAG TPA: EscU/YscU/HrcU family type III secretion system export apparatus switch protein [Solirubrobacteraceae bacterium]|jgi:flagellar biosynthetic protein FlhB|nr:EscU/YscU/HrcU family type III secretion system export apparatus switch protein [Solirubrobacteraceae bacterium]
MAQDDRTEKATPKHRKRAREKGQVARSTDLGGSLVLIAGLFAISITGPAIVAAGAATFREILSEIARPGRATTAAGLSELMHSTLTTIALTVGPIAAACVVTGVLASVAQVGLRPSVQTLKPDFRRINPVSGLRNLLSPNLIFEAVKAIAKVGVVGLVAGLALVPGLQGLASKVGISPQALGLIFGQQALGIAQRVAFAYLAIGLLDYGWKRYRHEKQLRMTKQQVKDEARHYGVSNEVKAALRRRQMQAARIRMMAAVPSADVVVTNPTHFAVALLYNGSRSAPEVVAKGKDLIAAQIRRIAEENDVPVVSDPPLARALHQSTEIGQVIPQELYAAVARVLAFVYRLAGRKRLAS